jgi:hypothetical protein
MNEKIMQALGFVAACVVGLLFLWGALGFDAALFNWLF